MIDKLFIIHYEPLIDRKKYLEPAITNLGFDYEFILMNSEKDIWIQNNIDNYYKFDPEVLNRKLNLNELSVSITHLEVYEKILRENYETCLILEDDAILNENFLEKLNIVKDQISDFDFVFLSTCCNLRKGGDSDFKIYDSSTSRCNNGYIVKSSCLNRVLENSKKISLPIDWHLNYIKEISNLKFGWMEPPIITQGSETIYKSNLR